MHHASVAAKMKNPKCPVEGPHDAHPFTVQTVETHPPGHNPRNVVTGMWCDGERVAE